MLERLTVKGFKSFADPTTLQLGHGVNVIVGPNGSGKSNLAEAILWALGEQRAGRLRAGGMADVLYAGGDRRPPAALAEVTLALARDDDHPSHPAEVEASRRLTRAGDALYRVGGGACRLLDLQEALAGRGLGPDALAVIRQGQVEALCTSTPEQRRAMVDAAAGVAVAKRRRRRAEQKLARVDERLVRARDLAGEVNARAQTLARQARAAERAAELDTALAAARNAVTAARARGASEAHAAARAEFERLGAVAGEAARTLDAARTARAAVQALRAEAVEGAQAAGERADALRTAADRVAGRLELARERVDSAERDTRRRAERREAARARLGELRAAAGAAATDVTTAEVASEAATVRASQFETADLEARTARRQAEEAASAAAAARTGAERAVAAAEREAAQAAAALSAAERRLEQLGPLRDLDAARLRAERREEVSAGRLERWSERVAHSEREAADAASARTAAEERVRQARSAARALAPPARGETSGPPTLGDGLEVEPGMERAVAAALGAALEAVAVSSLADAYEALEGGVPRAVIAVPGPPPVATPAGATAAWDLVRDCDEGARPHLRRLLADVWVVDALEALPDGLTGVAVTREGFALRPRDGVVSRAGEEWARRALHRRAVQAEQLAVAEAQAASAQAAAAAARHSVVVRRRRAAERSAARAATRLAAARAEADRRAAEVADAGDVLRRLQDDAGARAAAIAGADADRRATAAAAIEATAAATAAREEAEAASGRFRDAATAAADARAATAAAKARHAEARARVAAVEAVAEEPAGDGGGIALGRRAVAALDALAAALAPAVQRAAAIRDELAGAVRGRDRELTDAQSAAEAAETAADAAARAAHAAELAAAVAGERAAEAGPPPPADAVLPEPEEAAVALEGLERRRAAVGQVNPLAAAERAELAERETEMHEQIADLEATATSLRAHMSELDAAVAEGFDALFLSLCDRFEEVCGLLFPGGHGRLRAVRDEDGEPGIEVEVVPAGKRPRSLSLLSGGERSLVALGFCLALAMARPAPFYLLDEVEAALDDVNLRRFLGVVRRLADGGRQFLLITHQQPTVEIADTLFGVTMGAEGVSQVLARRLTSARPAADEPAHPALRAIRGGRSA